MLFCSRSANWIHSLRAEEHSRMNAGGRRADCSACILMRMSGGLTWWGTISGGYGCHAMLKVKEVRRTIFCLEIEPIQLEQLETGRSVR